MSLLFASIISFSLAVVEMSFCQGQGVGRVGLGYVTFLSLYTTRITHCLIVFHKNIK